MKKFFKAMLSILLTLVTIGGGASILFIGLVAFVPGLSEWVQANNLGYVYYICFGLVLAALVLPRTVVKETIVYKNSEIKLEGEGK